MEELLQHQELTAEDQLQTLGGHPVLDLLNTVTRIDGKSVDSLKNGNDVLKWIDRAGWRLTKGSRPSLPPRLLKTTRALREEIRALVENRKAGKRMNLEILNEFLEKSESYLQLSLGPDRTLNLHRSWQQRTAEQVLGPLAEGAAELLAEGDFSLIRRCENRKCLLWFYDRTRSHRRRWCSMAACGNRSKVKAFRDRRWHKSLTEKA
jgi:predicted RNA-binding Zn ribbon-like protein